MSNEAGGALSPWERTALLVGAVVAAGAALWAVHGPENLQEVKTVSAITKSTTVKKSTTPTAAPGPPASAAASASNELTTTEETSPESSTTTKAQKSREAMTLLLAGLAAGLLIIAINGRRILSFSAAGVATTFSAAEVLNAEAFARDSGIPPRQIRVSSGAGVAMEPLESHKGLVVIAGVAWWVYGARAVPPAVMLAVAHDSKWATAERPHGAAELEFAAVEVGSAPPRWLLKFAGRDAVVL